MKLVIFLVFLIGATSVKSQQYIKLPCIDCDKKQVDKAISDISAITGFEKKATSINKQTEEMYVTFVNGTDSLLVRFGNSAAKDSYQISQFTGSFPTLLKVNRELFGRQLPADMKPKTDYWYCTLPNGQTAVFQLTPSKKLPGKWVLKFA